ncbi:MAG TPA: SMC-Scp complex subunit ScpB [Candidatus Paceibacterota bacterium]|nr:SMC-Scp complex subunit ScpB [Candidatus Paceibacterota bacterium]
MALALSSRLEALLFAVGEPLTKKRIATLLDASSESVGDALNALRITLQDRGLSLIETETEVELRTSPEASNTIQKLRESELSRDLGRASLETLALILYKGGATRGEIDWVRGVNSTAAIRALLLRGLIERTEDASDKRRIRYQATVDALAHLGVAERSALPRFEEFTTALATQEAAQPTSDV